MLGINFLSLSCRFSCIICCGILNWLSISSLQWACYTLSVEGTEETLLVKQSFWFQFLFWFLLVLLQSFRRSRVGHTEVFCELSLGDATDLLSYNGHLASTRPGTSTCQSWCLLLTQTSCTPGLLPRFLAQCSDTVLCACPPVLAHPPPRLLLSFSVVTGPALAPETQKAHQPSHGSNCIFPSQVWIPAWCWSTVPHWFFLVWSASALGSLVGLQLYSDFPVTQMSNYFD